MLQRGPRNKTKAHLQHAQDPKYTSYHRKVFINKTKADKVD